MTAQSDAPREAAPLTGQAQVARVYAEALLNVALKHHKPDEMQQALESLVHDVFPAQPAFESYLSSPVKREEKERAIRAAFDGKVDPVFVNFLLALNHNGRLDLLRSIWAIYRDLNDLRSKRLRVKVRTAVPLPDDQRRTLQQELHDYFGLEPVIETRIDANLIGGMVVQVGDHLFDGSVKSKLDRMRNHLMVRSNYEIQSGRDRFSH